MTSGEYVTGAEDTDLGTDSLQRLTTVWSVDTANNAPREHEQWIDIAEICDSGVGSDFVVTSTHLPSNFIASTLCQP